MKFLYLFAFLNLCLIFNSFGQCTPGIAFGSGAAPTVSTGNCSAPASTTLTTCAYNNEYSTITGLTVGQTYLAGNCASLAGTDGGGTGSDITVRDGSTGSGTVLGFATSASGGTCVSFVATSTSATVQVNDPGCVASSGCNLLKVACTSCPPDPLATPATCNTTTTGLGGPSCSTAGMNLAGSASSTGGGGSILCGTSFPTTFPAQTTVGGACPAGGGGTGTTYGCLSSQPNPSWFALQTGPTAGSICLNMTNSANTDIDFAMYGPVPTCNTTSLQADCLGAPIDCDFTTAPGGQLNVASAPANSTYYVVVTNYSGTATDITINNNCPIPSTSTFTCPPPLAPLPVLFGNFDGRVLSNGNLLQWQTLTERNSSHFNVQISNDGIDFSTIKTISTKAENGHSNQSLAYEFLDQNVKMGSNYYRIEQVDNDNKVNYTRSIELINNNGGGIRIYPNPAENEVNIVFNNINSDVRSTVILTDIYGKIMREVAAVNNSINNSMSINISSLSKGIYFVKIFQNGKEVLVNKLVK